MRPRKLTTAEALARAEFLAAENSVLLRALTDMATGTVHAMEEVKRPDGERWTWYLLRPAAPDGGIIVTVWHSPTNAHDSVTARNADELLRNILGQWPAECYQALDRLRGAWWRANQQ